MTTEKLEDTAIACVVIALVELCGVMFVFVPALMDWSKGIPLKEYRMDACIGGTCLLLWMVTLIIQLIISHILKKRGSMFVHPVMGLVKDIWQFSFQLGEWGDKKVEDHLSRQDIRKSLLLRHFSQRINLRATAVAVVMTPVFILPLFGVIVAYARNSSAGINLFSRSTVESADIGGKIFITLICICLFFADVAALVRVRVKIGNLRADIAESGILIKDLDQEFRNSQCIGHDIWIGEKHIFMSGGGQSYMFSIDDIYEIDQKDIRGNNIPYYMLTITALTGEQANLISFDSHMKEKLVEAIGWEKEA